jgi:hypothetical protein
MNLTKNEIEQIVTSVGSGNFEIGGRKVRRKVIYVNADVSAKSGTFQLVEQKTDKEVGITNLDGGNQFAKDRDVIITAVRIGVDTTTASPKAGVYRSLPTAALQNGELRIKQDGELFSSPIGVLANQGVATNVEDNFFKIAPTYLKAQTAFQFEIETPAAIGATTSLQLMLDVIEFVG